LAAAKLLSDKFLNGVTWQPTKANTLDEEQAKAAKSEAMQAMRVFVERFEGIFKEQGEKKVLKLIGEVDSKTNSDLVCARGEFKSGAKLT
jgi:hypothetical protein